MRELSPPNRLAGGRTRPLCDPSCLLTIHHIKLCGGGQGGRYFEAWALGRRMIPFEDCEFVCCASQTLSSPLADIIFMGKEYHLCGFTNG